MESTVSILKALSDTNRLRVVAMLTIRPLCVCEIDQVLDISLSTISANLRKLTNAGLVYFEKEGKWIIYHLSKEKKFKDLLDAVLSMASNHDMIQKDKKMLKKVSRKTCSTQIPQQL
jgi:ArsR family transcriptional regulator, arsenate/arsenite/antimonite-responsive transcriptional repressor